MVSFQTELWPIAKLLHATVYDTTTNMCVEFSLGPGKTMVVFVHAQTRKTKESSRLLQHGYTLHVLKFQ